MTQEMSTQPNRTHAQRRVELEKGRNLPDLLRDMYLVQGKSEVLMAIELGISRPTVRTWLAEFGVKGRAA